jgi:L-alanine-DL-glutamate epimerase-like enolase superfamily enzyme
MRAEFRQVDWPFSTPFRIAYSVSTAATTVQVKLADDRFAGRGEALGVAYHGETVRSMLVQLESVKAALCQGISRTELAALLPAGGARNAVDCALWDLEAKRVGKRAWELAGLRSVRQVTTDYTIGLDSAEAMAQVAAALRQYSVLKLKLSGGGDLERVLAVRAARPDADLIVDANQAWSERLLRDLAPRFRDLGIKLIEQPLPRGADDALSRYESPVPLCADESCQTVESLSDVIGKYQYVNIKLDKTGGLTEALRLAYEARKRGLKLMVGCMAGSSLSMAPAFIVAQLCDFVDLDGPLLSTCDIAHPIRYEGSRMHAPERTLWG